MVGLSLMAPGAVVSAQTPAPAERVTFDEAIERAVARTPSAAPTTLNTGVEFEGTTVSPRHAIGATLDMRSAREAVASAERALTSVRAAAAQAQPVVKLVNVSFRAGAATNIEAIDAERRARDGDTAAAVAEDAVRRARLELPDALGQFP